jgi:hypothetical protein
MASKIIKYIFFWIGYSVMLYWFFVIGTWELQIGKWEHTSREVFAFFLFVIFTIMSFACAVELQPADKKDVSETINRN